MVAKIVRSVVTEAAEAGNEQPTLCLLFLSLPIAGDSHARERKETRRNRGQNEVCE